MSIVRGAVFGLAAGAIVVAYHYGKEMGRHDATNLAWSEPHGFIGCKNGAFVISNIEFGDPVLKPIIIDGRQCDARPD